jgi:hypothetical protein
MASGVVPIGQTPVGDCVGRPAEGARMKLNARSQVDGTLGRPRTTRCGH